MISHLVIQCLFALSVTIFLSCYYPLGLNTQLLACVCTSGLHFHWLSCSGKLLGTAVCTYIAEHSSLKWQAMEIENFSRYLKWHQPTPEVKELLKWKA